MKKLFIALLMLAVAGIQGIPQSLEKSFKVEKKYINIPIQSEQERQRVHFKVDGDVYTLFELAVDGDPENTKWVLYGVMGIYLIGDFDGKTFIPETEMLRYNAGGMTAAQTYNNEPDGRRLQIGWGHAEYPGMPFKHTFIWFADHHKGNLEDFKLSLIQGTDGLNPEPKTLIRNLEIHELKSIWE